MEWTGVNDLREQFLSFFESKGHLRLPSFPLVPVDDNSLLLINSGMAPMKKYFMGQVTPPRSRVTTCQKCIRTPDIETVGKTARHGTYFEMLGNFSFGDYFKKEVIPWAWEFITEVIKIPKDRLWVTIYEDDDEAFEIWTKDVGVPAERIVRMGKEDNFWEIGTGPCGPCSEIYYDRGEEYGCGKPDCGIGCDCDRYMEFWNLVFTQFDSDGEGNYGRLAHPNIDTGMGLERLACLVQGVDNLFEIDTMQNIMKHIMQLAGVRYKENEKNDVSLRVITDHIRSTVFMVGDGVLPTNEGRGYVLRRLLRRAARHGRLLGIEGPFLHKVAATVIHENASAYPELVEKQDYIQKVILMEEERFDKTIVGGMELLGRAIGTLLEKGKRIMDGAEAFRLYDTFGFPLDLIKEILSEKAIDLDEKQFTELMNDQRARARAARQNMDTVGWDEEAITGISPEDILFTGYDSLTEEATVLAVLADGGEDAVGTGETASILLDRTPFYAESGGQVGDTGVLTAPGMKAFVLDTKKVNGLTVHVCEMKEGTLHKGDKLTASVNKSKRMATMRNHTAAHLLQAALRQVLGDHVHQAGSYVDPSRVRFDFTHFSAMTAEELHQVERIVNEKILEGIPMTAQIMTLDEAKKTGAMALFSEKYGDRVRVCTIGEFSKEFCGGTHVDNTAKLGLFKIVSESSVAAGVRRIEGTTGFGVLELFDEQNRQLVGAAALLKVANPMELHAKLNSVLSDLREKTHEVAALSSQITDLKLGSLDDNFIGLGQVFYFTAIFKNTTVSALRTAGDKIKDSRPKAVALIACEDAGKYSLLCVCGKEAVAAGFHAGKIVKAIAQLTGGNGGGKPDSAMAGVGDPAKLEAALAQTENILKDMANA